MTAADHLRAAERLQQERQLRAECLGVLNDGFGEPAWDMLLELFIDDARGRPSTAMTLVEATRCDRRMAEPYIGFLASHAILQVDGQDAADLARSVEPSAVVHLSERGREWMQRYLERIAA